MQNKVKKFKQIQKVYVPTNILVVIHFQEFLYEFYPLQQSFFCTLCAPSLSPNSEHCCKIKRKQNANKVIVSLERSFCHHILYRTMGKNQLLNVLPVAVSCLQFSIYFHLKIFIYYIPFTGVFQSSCQLLCWLLNVKWIFFIMILFVIIFYFAIFDL